MSGLVGYGSSDEEDDVDLERPAKVAKTTRADTELTVQQKPLEVNEDIRQSHPTQLLQDPQQNAEVAIPTAETPPGPSAFDTNPTDTTDAPASASLSPYTFERQRLRELTMPTVPNFHIPDSPPTPVPNSEAAADLAATTKKSERFLELKQDGVHFNQRLQNTASLRNPSLLAKLMEFAGISKEESYASTLGGGMEIPTIWPAQCYPENLVKINERREKKRLCEREKVEFVAGTKSGGSSRTGTPKSKGEGRRTRFDRR